MDVDLASFVPLMPEQASPAVEFNLIEPLVASWATSPFVIGT